jgi:hypothetical protein
MEIFTLYIPVHLFIDPWESVLAHRAHLAHSRDPSDPGDPYSRVAHLLIPEKGVSHLP